MSACYGIGEGDQGGALASARGRHRHHRRPQRRGKDHRCASPAAPGPWCSRVRERRRDCARVAAVQCGADRLQRMHDLVSRRKSFAFETTCAYLPMLKRCKADGWRITLVYLWLSSPQAALDRVARRVRAGGHGIPADVVVRRYWAGLANMHLMYLPLADFAAIYDTSDGEAILVAERREDHQFKVHDAERRAQDASRQRRRAPAMKNMTPDEIIAAIDSAIKETAARAAVGKFDVVAGMLPPPLWPPSWGEPPAGKSPRPAPKSLRRSTRRLPTPAAGLHGLRSPRPERRIATTPTNRDRMEWLRCRDRRFGTGQAVAPLRSACRSCRNRTSGGRSRWDARRCSGTRPAPDPTRSRSQSDTQASTRPHPSPLFPPCDPTAARGTGVAVTPGLPRGKLQPVRCSTQID